MNKRPIDQLFENLEDLPVLDRTSQPTIVEKVESLTGVLPPEVREVEYPSDVNPQPFDIETVAEIAKQKSIPADYGISEGPPVRMVPRIQSDKKYSPPLEFRYNENRYLDEAREYIGGTYRAHYTTKSGGQVYDLIDGAGNGIPFSTSNIIKYAARFGKKGGNNRNDLLKVIHYATLALYSLDNEKA